MSDTNEAATTAATTGTAPLETPGDATAAPAPAVDEAPGPITLSQRAFFDAKREVSASRAAPPLVPLPRAQQGRPGGALPKLRPSEQVELSGGVLVITRTTPAWIATAVVALAGIVVALVLGLDASAAKDELARTKAHADELAKRLADAEIPRAPSPATPLASAALAPAPTATRDEDAAFAKPVADALAARLADEIRAREASVTTSGATVTLALEGGVLDKKGRLARRAADLLARAGAALGPLAKRVDVVAWSEGNLPRGKSAWGNSAARATTVAKALVQHGRVDAAKLGVVGRGEAKGAAARRLELVVATR